MKLSFEVQRFVYLFNCVPDHKGVEIEIGLQNWESDITLQTYLRSRID